MLQLASSWSPRTVLSSPVWELGRCFPVLFVLVWWQAYQVGVTPQQGVHRSAALATWACPAASEVLSWITAQWLGIWGCSPWCANRERKTAALWAEKSERRSKSHQTTRLLQWKYKQCYQQRIGMAGIQLFRAHICPLGISFFPWCRSPELSEAFAV